MPLSSRNLSYRNGTLLISPNNGNRRMCLMWILKTVPSCSLPKEERLPPSNSSIRRTRRTISAPSSKSSKPNQSSTSRSLFLKLSSLHSRRYLNWNVLATLDRTPFTLPPRDPHRKCQLESTNNNINNSNNSARQLGKFVGMLLLVNVKKSLPQCNR